MKIKKLILRSSIGILTMTIVTVILFKYTTSKEPSYMYSDSINFPDEETITINLSESPQIPWKVSDVSTYIIETFSAAVHGSLTPFSDSGFKDRSDSSVLFENYFCDGNKCYASIKRGINFHNGREATAYDVEFSFIRQLLKCKNDTFAITILDDVIGIDNFNKEDIKKINLNGVEYPSGLIKGIDVKDNYNIIFHLKRENSYFFQKISSGYIPIVPIEEFDSTYSSWKKFPIGFGKYKLIKSDLENYEFILKKFNKNENIPKYIRLIFSEEDIGDIKGFLASSQEKTDFNSIMIFPDIYINGGFLFNFKTELGANKNFRAALSYALDREKIAATSANGELVAEDQLIPGSGWQKNFRADIPVQKQNIEKAKSLLDTVPKHLWKDKVFHVHTFWPSKQDLNSLEYIIEVKKQLKEVGINIVFHNTNMSYTKFNENDDNVLWWTGFDTFSRDPNSNFAYFRGGSFFNNIYPNDPQFEKLYQDSTQNLRQSPIFVRNLSAYFTENHFMVVVFNVRKSFAYNKERIASFGNQYSPARILFWEIKLRN